MPGYRAGSVNAQGGITDGKRMAAPDWRAEVGFPAPSMLPTRMVAAVAMPYGKAAGQRLIWCGEAAGGSVV